MVRAAFGNNNIDTCARVCHSPTGYGLKQTFGTSAGTQDFALGRAGRRHRCVIGANPTDAHPVFASRMKRRLREGAQLIVVDPRRIDLVRIAARRGGLPPAGAAGHQRRLRQRDGHVVVTEGLCDEEFVARALRGRRRLPRVHRPTRALARGDRARSPASRPPTCALPPGCTPPGRNSAIYYGLGVTEHSQGSTMVMGMANLAMVTGNIGREGVGVNPLRGQNNVQGSCDMGSFPHELPGYRHVSGPRCARSTSSCGA